MGIGMVKLKLKTHILTELPGILKYGVMLAPLRGALEFGYD